MITHVTSLYNQDSRYGDGLIDPLRQCSQELRRDVSDLKRDGFINLGVTSKKILHLSIIFFATIISVIPAAIGLLMKACQNTPVIIAAREGPDLLSPFPEDLLIYIATYLPTQDLLKARFVSKYFDTRMKSPYLWINTLTHEDLRMHGATTVGIRPTASRGNAFLVHIPNYTPEDEYYLTHPLEQLVTYNALRKNSKEHRAGALFLRFSRLAKGGPLAFEKVPKISLDRPCAQLTPQLLDLPLSNFSTPLSKSQKNSIGAGCSIIRQQQVQQEEVGGEHSFLVGIDSNNILFFALRVVHAGLVEEQNTQSMIIFAYEGGRFFQKANGPWRADELRLSNQSAENFLLRLLNNDPLDATMHQGITLYKKP